MAKKTAAPKTEMMEHHSNAAISVERPDWLPEVDPSAPARGSENVGSADLIIPRLEIVQALSPIKEENDDARDGDIYNSVTGEIYGQQVNVIPIYYRKEYLVWAVREKGKPIPPDSFKGAYGSAEAAESAIGDLDNPDAYEFIETPQQF